MHRMNCEGNRFANLLKVAQLTETNQTRPNQIDPIRKNKTNRSNLKPLNLINHRRPLNHLKKKEQEIRILRVPNVLTFVVFFSSFCHSTSYSQSCVRLSAKCYMPPGCDWHIINITSQLSFIWGIPLSTLDPNIRRCQLDKSGTTPQAKEEQFLVFLLLPSPFPPSPSIKSSQRSQQNCSFVVRKAGGSAPHKCSQSFGNSLTARDNFLGFKPVVLSR